MNKISKFAAIVLVIFLAGCAVPVIVYEITSEVQEGKRIDKENKSTNADTKELKFK
jgi:outer membrane murein-binding lipoprotein Lpp